MPEECDLLGCIYHIYLSSQVSSVNQFYDLKFSWLLKAVKCSWEMIHANLEQKSKFQRSSLSPASGNIVIRDEV
jgi:hypothetical protein